MAKIIRDESVDAAEKEASEVLHSLLSVERIKNPDQYFNPLSQVVFVDEESDINRTKYTVNRQQWNESLPSHSSFNSYHSGNYQNNEWNNALVALAADQSLQQIEFSNEENLCSDYETENNINSGENTSNKQKCKSKRKRYRKNITLDDGVSLSISNIEDNAQEVQVRFKLGCECQDDKCFKGLNPENVYKHRLNIAELTKEEHDMYLMGVTMACMSDPGLTAKQRKRTRLRAQYVYQGRRVCLSAFLYLENCTLYQLKRIRKHVMTHGVAPRVHGNHGKKPHNVFPLDTYRRATEFLKLYIERYTIASSNLKAPILFPPDITRKTVHNTYMQHMMEIGPPGQKVMGYSTFRHFMKEQFPQLRFCKLDSGFSLSSNSSNNTCCSKHNNCSSNSVCNNNGDVSNQLPQQQSHPCQQTQHIITTCLPDQNNVIHNQSNVNLTPQQSTITSVPPNSVQSCPSASEGSMLTSSSVTAIPVILSEVSKEDRGAQQQTAFILAPLSQMIPQFQDGQTVAVTPISNTAYAFATL